MKKFTSPGQGWCDVWYLRKVYKRFEDKYAHRAVLGYREEVEERRDLTLTRSSWCLQWSDCDNWFLYRHWSFSNDESFEFLQKNVEKCLR